MKIHLATDHAGLDLKNSIKNYLLKKYKPNENYLFIKKLKKHLDPNSRLGKNKLFQA